jgi:hypothetical protein
MTRRVKLFAADFVAPGTVLFCHDRKPVCTGNLCGLHYVDDGEDPETTEIHVNPADVDEVRVRWFAEGSA